MTVVQQTKTNKLGGNDTRHYQLRVEADVQYRHNARKMVDAHNKNSVIKERFNVGQYVSVPIPGNLRIKSFSIANIPGIIIQRIDKSNTYRVVTRHGLIETGLKPEQFIPVNKNVYPELQSLANFHSTEAAIKTGLKVIPTSIKEIYTKMIDIEKVQSAQDPKKVKVTIDCTGNSDDSGDMVLQEAASRSVQEEEETLYIPEYILDEKCVDNCKWYKVKWLDWSESDATWEKANLYDTHKAYSKLIQYWTKYKTNNKIVIHNINTIPSKLTLQKDRTDVICSSKTKKCKDPICLNCVNKKI
jgi:hypothetical protein